MAEKAIHLLNCASRIDEALQALASASPDDLREQYRRTFARAAPKGFRAGLLRQAIAHALRARRPGAPSLSREAIRLLDRLAEADDPSPVLLERDGKGLKPASLLLREHDSIVHQVMVMTEGYAWKGQTYPSLSSVAFAMTGTRWNGPRFFGLRGGKDKKAKGAEMAPEDGAGTEAGELEASIGSAQKANPDRMSRPSESIAP